MVGTEARVLSGYRRTPLTASASHVLDRSIPATPSAWIETRQSRQYRALSGALHDRNEGKNMWPRAKKAEGDESGFLDRHDYLQRSWHYTGTYTLTGSVSARDIRYELVRIRI